LTTPGQAGTKRKTDRYFSGGALSSAALGWGEKNSFKKISTNAILLTQLCVSHFFLRTIHSFSHGRAKKSKNEKYRFKIKNLTRITLMPLISPVHEVRRLHFVFFYFSRGSLE